MSDQADKDAEAMLESALWNGLPGELHKHFAATLRELYQKIDRAAELLESARLVGEQRREEIARLKAELASITADRDIWIADYAEQNYAFGQADAERNSLRIEISHLKAELADWEINAGTKNDPSWVAANEIKLERDRLKAESTARLFATAFTSTANCWRRWNK